MENSFSPFAFPEHLGKKLYTVFLMWGKPMFDRRYIITLHHYWNRSPIISHEELHSHTFDFTVREKRGEEYRVWRVCIVHANICSVAKAG